MVEISRETTTYQVVDFGQRAQFALAGVHFGPLTARVAQAIGEAAVRKATVRDGAFAALGCWPAILGETQLILFRIFDIYTSRFVIDLLLFGILFDRGTFERVQFVGDTVRHSWNGLSTSAVISGWKINMTTIEMINLLLGARTDGVDDAGGRAITFVRRSMIARRFNQRIQLVDLFMFALH